MTDLTKRSTLMLLGLAPSAAIGIEAFASEKIDTVTDPLGAGFSNAQAAAALRNLAALLEGGKADLSEIEVSAKATPDSVLTHEFLVRFVSYPDKVS